MKHSLALAIARDIQAQLAPACVQIEIAGGLLRGKPDVHDIELVAQPKMSPLVTNFFGEVMETASLLDERVTEMVEAGLLIYGGKKGSRYMQFYVPPSRIALDLFIVLPPAQWGYIMAIRTGPANYSQWLVTRRTKNGALPSHLSARNGAIWEGDRQQRVIETPTEASFFEVLGLPMPEPTDRIPKWGQFSQTDEAGQ